MFHPVLPWLRDAGVHGRGRGQLLPVAALRVELLVGVAGRVSRAPPAGNALSGCLRAQPKGLEVSALPRSTGGEFDMHILKQGSEASF